MKNITYDINGSVYINMTNRCSNNCDFCIRNGASGAYGYVLWLDVEPTAAEVIAQLERKGLDNYKEVVFCGFGEPIYRYDDIKVICDYVHAHGGTTRINTNGQAQGILGRDITNEFSNYIDIVNVSLNATTADKYQAICHSVYGEEAYAMLIDFTKKLVGKCKRVVLSIVDCVGAKELERAAIIAQDIGAELKIRAYDEGDK